MAATGHRSANNRSRFPPPLAPRISAAIAPRTVQIVSSVTTQHGG